MAKEKPLPPGIVIDSREQLPYFGELDLPVVTLKAGDYSLSGYETKVAVERKTKEDAYNCIGQGRRRFEACLERLSRLERKAVVIECDLRDFAIPPPYSTISASKAVGSFVSWSCRFNIPVFWCGSREYAERVTFRFLMAYWKHVVEKYSDGKDNK